MLDTKVNKGCTVTAQPQHRVEPSCQRQVGVQSRLMGSKKALRKREFQEFQNHKLIEPYGGLLGSRKNCTGFHANGISRWSALGHWGLTRGDEGYGLTSGAGEPEYLTHPCLEWPKRVSVGRKRLLRFPELSLQERVVGTALFKMDNQQ